ncbi:MAG: hypothetical protein QF479_00050 [Candidatus Poseidoniaceae archaeon]|jgi:hypothetical protein|nr:hypothetical protein [Candidatus Poseidoniaceae archaeon]
MSTEDGQGEEEKKEGDVLVAFLLENRTLMNYASIIMIVYAVWATIEVITNAYGATWWPPETGIPADEIFNNPDKTQNINNGLIIALGAICGTLGFLIQYFYRAAPYVDASMTATAALIIKQATGGASVGLDAEEVIAKAEVAATIAADTAIRESSEDTLEQAKETAEAAATAAVEEMMAAVQEKVDTATASAEAAGVAAKEAADKAEESTPSTPSTPSKESEEAEDKEPMKGPKF